MAFIINHKGERVHVNMEVSRFSQTCPLYADDAELKEYFILNLYKGKRPWNGDNECELIKQIELWKEPTKEEIMYKMWENGLSRYDFVTIERGYILDWGSD